jgi:hypothetical protein
MILKGECRQERIYNSHKESVADELDKSYRSAIGQDKARTFMRAGGMMH